MQMGVLIYEAFRDFFAMRFSQGLCDSIPPRGALAQAQPKVVSRSFGRAIPDVLATTKSHVTVQRNNGETTSWYTSFGRLLFMYRLQR
jgi:hypothetical protein